jgi:hypothetical protein
MPVTEVMVEALTAQVHALESLGARPSNQLRGHML